MCRWANGWQFAAVARLQRTPCALQLLGRSVDMNKLLTQRLTLSLRDAIHQAILRFESQDLAAIVVRVQVHRVGQILGKSGGGEPKRDCSLPNP